MNSNGANTIIQDALNRATDRGMGIGPQSIRFSATRAAEVAIPDVSSMPAKACTTVLQNSSGKDLFLVGYSAIGGPDVIG